MVRSVTLAHARQVARRVMSFSSDKETINYLHAEVRGILPDDLMG